MGLLHTRIMDERTVVERRVRQFTAAHEPV